MSDRAEFDFWLYVNCAKCHLPFSSDIGASVPFWVTECGHVVCNAHLKSDQSCSQCGASNIQLAPLQREMDPPMSEWFSSIPYALDSMAFATKFQLETMAAQVDFYREKYQQKKRENEKLKKVMIELKRSNTMIMNQSAYGSHSTLDDDNEPSESLNSHGKRQMIQRRPQTTSSPYSYIGASRLTIPPGQNPPELTHRTQGYDGLSAQEYQSQEPPGSSGFAQQFSYQPPTTPHNQPSKPRADFVPGESHENLPPARFRPAKIVHPNANPNRQGYLPTNKLPKAMGPPPTPQHTRPAAYRDSRQPVPSVPPQHGQGNSNAPPNRYLPPEQRFSTAVNAGSSSNSRRFMPPTPHRDVNQPQAEPPSRAPSRAMQIPQLGHSSRQRAPFVPNNGAGLAGFRGSG